MEVFCPKCHDEMLDLRQELIELEDELILLRRDLAPLDLTAKICSRLGFPPAMSRILAALLAHKIRSTEQLRSLSPNALAPKSGVAKTYVSRLRKEGIVINKVSGLGYSLPDEERARIAVLLSI